MRRKKNLKCDELFAVKIRNVRTFLFFFFPFCLLLFSLPPFPLPFSFVTRHVYNACVERKRMENISVVVISPFPLRVTLIIDI